nr:immunoglobulin heavy chain junction region [Mus musculus]
CARSGYYGCSPFDYW